jgi:hypothetical protein
MLTTPDFIISTATLADNGKEAIEGDLSLAQIRESWATMPLIAIGLFIVLWFGGIRDLIGWLNRVRIAHQSPPEVQAWRVFKKVFTDAREYRQFTPIYAEKVASALRKYLKMQSLTLEQIAATQKDDPRTQPLLTVLRRCHSVIYARVDQPVVLSETEIAEIYQIVVSLVPKLPLPQAKAKRRWFRRRAGKNA